MFLFFLLKIKQVCIRGEWGRIWPPCWRTFFVKISSSMWWCVISECLRQIHERQLNSREWRGRTWPPCWRTYYQFINECLNHIQNEGGHMATMLEDIFFKNHPTWRVWHQEYTQNAVLSLKCVVIDDCKGIFRLYGNKEKY